MESKSYVNHWDNSISLRQSKFIEKAKGIHNNKYDYSKVVYKNIHYKVCIICPEHGEFYQDPASHLKGCGCPECGNKKIWETRKKYTTEDIVSAFKNIHKDKYDYSKVNYIDSQTKVCVICPEHGEFWILPSHHINGVNCPKCMGNAKYTTESWISKAKEIHNNKYDYSKIDYVNSQTKVCIICPEHGEFWQKPQHHLDGHGCPKCNLYKLETDVEKKLIDNNIKYVNQKTFEWLSYKKKMYLDFFLPEYNIGIECQGRQHFYQVDYFGGDSSYENTRDRDLQKLKLCKEHNIEILYYTDVKLEEYPYDVITDLDELIKRIKG